MEEKIKYPRLNLGQIEAFMNKVGGTDGLKQFLSGELVIVPKATTNKLLECVGVVTVPSEKRFVVDDHFKDCEMIDGVRVFLGENFKKRFGGKIEKNVAGCDIRVHKLLRASRDLPIRYELDELGEDNEETLLAHLWHFLKQRGDKGGWFVFYIWDDQRTPWAVSADWNSDGWDVDAFSVGCRRGWLAGGCICSR